MAALVAVDKLLIVVSSLVVCDLVLFGMTVLAVWHLHLGFVTGDQRIIYHFLLPQ